MIDGLKRDVLHGVHMVRRQPGTMVVVALTLGLGIGVNTTVFTVANTLFFRAPSGVLAPERLVRIQERVDDGGFDSMAYPQYAYLRERATVFADLAAYSHSSGLALRHGNTTDHATGVFVTGNFFSMLGVRPGAGRLIQPADDREGADPVAVLGFSYWQRTFGANPAVIGSTVLLFGRPFTVVGVAPPEFPALSYDDQVPDVWLPVWSRVSLLGRTRADMVRTPGFMNRFLTTVGRLQDGETHERARAVVTGLAQQLALEFPNEEGKGRLTTLAHVSGSPNRRPAVVSLLRVLFGVAFIVLVIACANLANLLLVKATARTREVRVRLSLGATRVHLVRQFLSETLALAVAGGIVGVLISLWLSALLVQRLPLASSVATTTAPPTDLRVLGFAGIIALLSALAFGLAPALHASRLDVADVLRSGTRVAAGSSRTRAALLIGQFALTLVLLTGTAVLVQSLQNMRAIPIGYSTTGHLGAYINLRPFGYDREAALTFFTRLLERVQALPAVSEASLTNAAPLTGSVSSGSVQIESSVSAGEGPEIMLGTITPGYFQTLGLNLKMGRNFTESDRTGVAIVNEAFARKFWPGQNPIGKRIRQDGWSTVVGVVQDARIYSVFDAPAPMVFQPLRQQPTLALDLQLLTAGDPLALIPSIRREVAALDANVGVSEFQTLHYRYQLSFRRFAINAELVGMLAALALLLAAVGLYATVSYSVTQRTREIGVRMAVGARTGDVLRLMFRHTMALAGAGLFIGGLLSLAATRVIGHWLYEVSPLEPRAFLLAAVVLVGSVCVAAWLPARRATRVDPLVALRQD